MIHDNQKSQEELISELTLLRQEFNSYRISTEKKISELMQDVKKRKNEGAKFAGIFHHSPHGIAITNLENGKYLEVNDALICLLGYSRAEFMASNISGLNIWTNHEDLKSLITELQNGKVLFNGEYDFMTKFGKIITCQLTSCIIDISNQRVLFSELNDITRQKRAEKELLLNELRFRQVVEQSMTLIWEVDASGLFTYISPIARSIWGYDPGDLVGKKHFYDLHPVEGREQFKNAALEMFDRKEVFKNLLNPLVTAQNTTIWMSTNGVPIMDDQNHLMGYRGADNDVTDQKLAENRLKQRETELNEAQKIARMCSWDLDLVTDKLTWSENYYHIMGIPFGAEMKTEFFLERVHPNDLRMVEEKYQELKESQKPVTYDVRLLLPDNQYHWIQNNIVPTSRNGSLVSLRGVNIDVTDKKIDEYKIRLQNERFSAIITAIPDLIFVMTQNGDYLEVFASESNKLLISPEYIIGSNIRQAFNAEMSTLLLKKVNDCLTRKELVAVVYEVMLPESQSTHFEARIVPLDQDKVLILSRDVTEQAKNEILINRLSQAIEQSPVLVVITDTNGQIEYVNHAFETVTGYTLNEVVGQNVKMLESGLTSPKVYESLQKTIPAGGKWHGEWISKKKSGELYWEDVSISPITDSTGKVINYLAVKQDITLRKQTEEVLRQSEESYRLMFGNNPQPMWIYDLETLAFLEINEAAMTHYGYSREEFLSMSLKDIRPPEDVESLLADIELTNKTYNPAGEWRHLKKNGEIIFVEITSHSIVFNDINARHVLIKDITKRKMMEREILDLNLNLEHKIRERTIQLNNLNNSLLTEIDFRIKTEKALSESEKSYRQVVENVNEIIFQTDTTGLWLFLNKSWEEVTGFSIAESLGKPFNSYVHPDDIQGNIEQFTQLILQEKDHIRHEVRYVTKTGHYKWIEIYASLGINENNEIIGTYGTLQDITERKKSEELIQKARLEAEVANLAKSEFLSRMSHELRTPLNSILGFAQLLELGDPAPKQIKSIGHIIRSGRHLLDLINEVLDISRIEAGHISMQMEQIYLNKLHQEIIELVAPLASENKIEIRLTSNLSNDFTFMSDSKRLKQVLLNLTNNAIKYNKPGGSVLLQTEIKNRNDSTALSLRITVTDTGIGISPNDIPKLFTPFERIGAERSNTEGTGLGLAVVKKIILELGGEVGVESSLGKGSTFWVELPYRAEIHDTNKSSTINSLKINHTNKKGSVLYIEDNVANYELVEQFLQDNRPKIKLLTDIYGKMTLPLAVKYKPDLILLDLNLPDMDGFQVLQLLKSDIRTSSIPLVVVSADATQERLTLFREGGAFHYLTKPINLIELLKIVDDFLPNFIES